MSAGITQLKPSTEATPTAGPEASSANGASANTAALKGMNFADGEAALTPGENGGSAGVSGVDTSPFERWVQSSLNGVAGAFALPCGGVEVNGSLRGGVRTAIKAFQKHARHLPGGKSLGVDGIVGKNTTAALEGVTGTSAPTTTEAQLTQSGPSTSSAAPGGGGAAAPGPDASSAGTGGTPAPEPVVDAKPGTPGGGTPVESTEKTDVEALEGDKVPGNPAEKRTGPAGMADTLRAQFSKGFLVSLSIPAAYDSGTDAYNEAKENGYASVDGYAYKVQFPRWAPGHASQVQAVWKTLRASMGKLGDALPANYATADDNAKGKIHSAIMGSSSFATMKQAMFSDDAALHEIAQTAFGNNVHIPNSAASYAKAQGAIAADGGAPTMGKSMIYKKKAEIAPLVAGTSAAVGQLLGAHAPADGAKEGQAEQDAAASKVRFLTISSHGASKWMGGHGRASAASMTNKDVPDIVGGMASALAPDVRVRLFACHTSKDGNKDTTKGEGTIADVFREELNKAGKTEGGVIGHRESGETQTNGTTRFFSAGAADGAKDWRSKDVFTPDYLQGFLAARNLTVKGNQKLVEEEAKDYFGREGWMEDITSIEALQTSVRARWEADYPDAAAVMTIKGVKAPKTAK